MATILVTGGCGMIGEKVCSGLLKRGNTVIAVDKNPSDYNAEKENYFYRQASPGERGRYGDIFDEFDLDHVVHLACTVDNDLGPIVEEDQIAQSAACDKFIYKLAIAKQIKKFILVSTTQIYKQPENREPIREDDPEKPFTNYAKLKAAAEHAFAYDVRGVKARSDANGEQKMICCVMRIPAVYALDFYDNLISRITDPKDGSLFVFRTGEYGFHMCCVHNISDFIIGFLRQADTANFTGVYNVADSSLVMASEIITFMKENHRFNKPVLQRNTIGVSLKAKIFGSNVDKSNYRFLDITTLDKNFMFDITKASRLCPFRWNIKNTK